MVFVAGGDGVVGGGGGGDGAGDGVGAADVIVAAAPLHDDVALAPATVDPARGAGGGVAVGINDVVDAAGAWCCTGAYMVSAVARDKGRWR